MKVFISWSGDRSRTIAFALSQLLPDAIQGIEPWMSQQDIEAGARWSIDMNEELESSGFGILCLTPENLNAPWVMFEAGSLAKSVSTSRVVPYLFQLIPTDVSGPLSQFQCAEATKQGTLSLLRSINTNLAQQLTEERLGRVFQRWWPDFSQRLATVPAPVEMSESPRDDRALLEEILQHVRDLRHEKPAELPIASTRGLFRAKRGLRDVNTNDIETTK